MSSSFNLENFRKKQIERTKSQVLEKLSKTDFLIIKAIDFLEVLEKSQNPIKEQASAFYLVENGKVDSATKKLLEESKIKLKDLEKLKEDLKKYIEEKMERLPNLNSVCGAILGAKILKKAGSLERLSRLPASTIQTLGAEKALFKHYKFMRKIPKYGFIFNHPLIRILPQKNKGKFARTLASIISIAAKLDFAGRPLDKNLMQKLEKRHKSLGMKK